MRGNAVEWSVARRPVTIEQRPDEPGQPRVVTYQVSTSGNLRGFPALVAALALLAGLGAIVVLGVITFAFALWIGLGLALLAVISALLRSVFGGPRRHP